MVLDNTNQRRLQLVLPRKLEVPLSFTAHPWCITSPASNRRNKTRSSSELARVIIAVDHGDRDNKTYKDECPLVEYHVSID